MFLTDEIRGLFVFVFLKKAFCQTRSALFGCRAPTLFWYVLLYAVDIDLYLLFLRGLFLRSTLSRLLFFSGLSIYYARGAY